MVTLSLAFYFGVIILVSGFGIADEIRKLAAKFDKEEPWQS